MKSQPAPYCLQITYEQEGGTINYMITCDKKTRLQLHAWFVAKNKPKVGEAMVVPFSPVSEEFENRILTRMCTANELVKSL